MRQAQGSFRNFKRLFKYASRHRRDFWLGCFYSFWKKLFDIAPEILIGIAIDVVVNRERSFLSRWGIEDALQQLVFLSVLTLLIWIFESLFEYLHLIKWRGLAQNLQHDFRVDAYTHLQRLDMAYFEDQSTGGLVAVLNDDINQLERFFNEGMNSLVQITTSCLLVGAVFFVLAPKVAVVAFVPMPIIFLAAFYFQKKAAPLYFDVREKAGVIGSRLSNNISGIATIRSFATEEREIAKVAEESQAYVNSNARAIALSSTFNPLIRVGVLIGFLGTFIVGGMMTLRGELEVGSYGVLVFLSQRLLWPLRDLAATVDLFERAMASAERVLDLLRIPLKLEVTGKPGAKPRDTGLEMAGVSFAYGNGVPVLKGIDVSVAPGKTVAIVGPTGSGKSTVTKLLLRFYEAQSGTIRFGGVDLREFDPRELRREIGLVSQDVFLFHGTIFENIAYAKPGASVAEVAEAARKAYADEFIERFPQGLETIIGERGQKLSGGQRQRISIARVILKNPSVLILDEATSAVDNETEAVIQRSLKEISRDRTTVVIAHRLSTVTHADTIYVLDAGSITETGRHDDLLRKRGVYAQLWSLQVRGEPQTQTV